MKKKNVFSWKEIIRMFSLNPVFFLIKQVCEKQFRDFPQKSDSWNLISASELSIALISNTHKIHEHTDLGSLIGNIDSIFHSVEI